MCKKSSECICLNVLNKNVIYWQCILDKEQIHFFLKKSFYWRIVDLQCVSFWCTAKWFIYIYICVCVYIYIQIHTHTYIFSFLDSFPLWFITRYWIYIPVLYSRPLLIYFIHSSWFYVLHQNSILTHWYTVPVLHQWNFQQLHHCSTPRLSLLHLPLGRWCSSQIPL